MMSFSLTRRSLLRTSGLAFGAGIFSSAAYGRLPESVPQDTIHLNLNENAFGPSPSVAMAIQSEFSRISRYADTASAQALSEQVAAYERVPVEQIVLGEILGALGLYLGSRGGPGGEFIYSTPGYLALVDAASHVGGVGAPVPLNREYRNDLPALSARINKRTRAIYLINPHNPTGTLNDDKPFKQFLREVSQQAPVIVDEAYLEYTPDFEKRSAVSLVRDGVNVLVFRTFDKIHGLAGLPIGYSIVPRDIGEVLRKEGFGDAEGLGRFNIAAASAALADTGHVQEVRKSIAAERVHWNSVLDELKLQRTDAQGDFVFFDTGKPHEVIATGFKKAGIEIGRTFPPYSTWARITIGLPQENKRAQEQLRRLVG
jgi:histidinol-phosphate aminotransferase